MTDEARVVHLTGDQSAFVDELVANGEYSSSDEVLRAGVEALQQRKDRLERWLREEVLPVAEAVDADPSLLIPADQVFAELRARHKARFGG